MIKTGFHIPFEEKYRILSLHESRTKKHYLLSEQQTISNPITLTLPNNSFQGGKYSQFNKEQVDSIINQINNYLQTFPKNQRTKVEIVSSESKVTNYDREKYPSTGDPKIDYIPEKKLPEGQLSKLRAETLRNYLVDKLPKNVEIVVRDLGAQGPDWKINPQMSTDDIRKLANSSEYTKHQYVTFNILAQGEKEEEIRKICNFKDEGKGGQAKKENNFVFVEKTIDISQLPDGQKLKFVFIPADVPDMLTITTGDKTYSTGFVGVPGEYWSIYLATFLGNAYNGKPPLPFPQDLKPISTDYVLNKLTPNQGIKDILGAAVNIKWSKDYETNAKQIKWYTFDKLPIKGDNTDADFAGRRGGSIIITKDSSMKNLTYRVYSPLGTTVWTLTARCI